MEQRQAGRTSQQMLAAPPGAFFVWCNSKLSYPKALARHLGRDDLQIKPLSWLQIQNLAAWHAVSGVVLDHAAYLEESGREAVRFLSQWSGAAPCSITLKE